MLPSLRVLSVSMLIGLSMAHADTCVGPSTFAIHSEDGNIAVRIDPGSADEPGTKKVACIATLTKWNPEVQSYLFLRRVTLRNPESPLTAVITNDTRFLVTFDDVCRMGRTENAVVIYDLQNGTVHAHRLEDFLPKSYRESLQDSVSNTLWRGEPSVSDHTVYVPPPRHEGIPPAHIHIDPAKNEISVKIREK